MQYLVIENYQDLIIRLFFVICGGYVPDFWTVNTEFALKKVNIDNDDKRAREFQSQNSSLSLVIGGLLSSGPITRF